MLRRTLLAVFIFFTQLTYGFATDCSDIFPGSTSLGVNGSTNFASPGDPIQCNGGSCTPAPTFTVPTMPSITPSGSFSTNSLTAGVYQHTSWGLSANSTVNFSGNGTAVIYFSQDITLPNSTTINPSGNPENVLIIVNGSMTIRKDAMINANIYATGSISIGNYNAGFTTINGAVSAAGAMSVFGEGSFNFSESYIKNMDSQGFCESNTPTQPLAEYRFDESTYDGSNDEVIDSVGGFHGRAISTQPAVGKVCNAADLSAYGTGDYLILDESILHAKTDFTVSLWVNTGKTSNQSVLSGAGSSGSNEYIFWFINSTNFRPYLEEGYNGEISTTSISDNDWHHLVWTRSGSQNCLYQDNVLQGCNTLSTSALNIQSLILGQEQDSIGGGFVASQGWEGQIDELLVFDSAISTSDIDQIYNNQNAGLGYDGTARTCPALPDADPIANFRFDECTYSGANSDTIDQTGNYAATSQNAIESLSTGVIESAADITHYSHHFTTSIPVPSTFSISTWFKKPTSTINSRYFVLGAMQGGGDLLYLDRNNNWRWGVYDGNSSTNGSYSFSSLDNNWHHLVAVYSGSQTQLYIDGALVDTINRKPSGTIQYIGTSYDSVGTSSAQGFRAPLDEFMVFDVELSTSQIMTIYQNQLAENNYEGTTRAAVNCSTEPLAFYQFEQTDFSSGIVDSSGYDNHASNNNGLSTAAGKYCRAFDTNGTNSASITDNVFISSLDLDDDVGTQGTISFWFNSHTAWDQGGYNGGERTLFDASIDGSGADKYFVLEIQSSGRLRFTFEDSNDGDFSIQEPSVGVRTANTWYYVTVTWDYESDLFELYVDANLRSQQSQNTNGNMSGLGPIVFGDNASTYSANGNGSLPSRTSANGKFDEVRIYPRVLSQTEITADMDDNNGCVNNINHYQIIHDGNGLTCELETITVKACTNIYDGTCVLSTNEVTLDVVATGSSVVTNNITFTGSTTTNIAYTTPETVVLSLVNPTIAPESATVCNDNSAGSCNLIFDNTGFKFLVDGNSVDIPTQIAGKPSNTGFSSSNFALQAIKTNTSTGACEAAITNIANIEIAAKCENPVACAGNKVVINNTPISTLANADALSYTSVSLDFGNNTDNTADFNFTYPDVGQVKLYARYNIPVNGSPSGSYMNGNSNSFVVRPFGFHMNIAPDSDENTTNPKAQNSSGNKFKKAGENFEVVVSSVQWQAGDDGNLDGIPDSNLLLKNNLSTPNFGNEISPVNVEISHDLVAPDPITSELGTLSGGLYSTFSNGVKSQNINWNEVGVVSLTARIESNGNYLTGGTVTNTEPYVGRFTPDHFELDDIVHGDIRSVCNGNLSEFTYIGEMDEQKPTEGALQYGIEPEFTITAKSAICVANVCSTTKNYTGDFVKLLENGSAGRGVNKTTPLTDGDKTGTNVPVEKLALQSNVIDNYVSPLTIPENNGVLTYTFNSSDNFVYIRNGNSKVEPFPSDINLEITSIIDEDDISAIDYDSSDDLLFSGVLTLHPIGTNIRFGRWNIENAYGPETENLPVAMAIQQWNGTAFETNTDETCLIPQYGNKVTTGSFYDPLTDWHYRLLDTADGELITPNNTSVIPPNPLGSFESGEYQQFIFNAPDEPAADANYQRGSLKFEYAVPTWLKYDWQNQDGTYDDNPTGQISFGLFRGNDRIISWREVGN